VDLKPLVGWSLDVARDGSFQALVVVRDYQLTPLLISAEISKRQW
jgi:hypothetical protein